VACHAGTGALRGLLGKELEHRLNHRPMVPSPFRYHKRARRGPDVDQHLGANREARRSIQPLALTRCLAGTVVSHAPSESGLENRPIHRPRMPFRFGYII
jgi:hypothetical protein